MSANAVVPLLSPLDAEQIPLPVLVHEHIVRFVGDVVKMFLRPMKLA